MGHGGTGTVYEALTFNTDGEVDQRVAVKLVKRGMDSEFILNRFERERRILGALDHPYIARGRVTCRKGWWRAAWPFHHCPGRYNEREEIFGCPFCESYQLV